MPKKKKSPYRVDLSNYGLGVVDLTDDSSSGGLTAKEKSSRLRKHNESGQSLFPDEHEKLMKELGLYDIVENERLRKEKAYNESPEGKKMWEGLRGRGKRDVARWDKQPKVDFNKLFSFSGLPKELFTGKARSRYMRKRKAGARHEMIKTKTGIAGGVKTFGDYLKDQERVRTKGRTRRVRKLGHTAQ